MSQKFFTRRYILITCSTLIICLTSILLIKRSHQELDFGNEIDDATLAYMDTYRNSETLTESERLALLQKNVVSKYPNADISISIKLDISEKAYNLSKLDELPVVQHNQLLYRKQKGLLKDHPNSPKLLLHLARLGFRSYPEDAISYCNKVISIDPDNVNAYLISGDAYQILGNFDIALSRLKEGNHQVLNRIITELNRQYPYATTKNLPVYYAHDVNNAKAYMRGLGHKVGSDVDYDLDKIVTYTQGLVIGSRMGYPLANGITTAIVDMFYLEQIMTSIDAIQDDNPIYTPNSKVPIIKDISKNTDR